MSSNQSNSLSNDSLNINDDPNEILKRILKDETSDDDSRTFNHEEEIEDYGSPIFWDKRYEEDAKTVEWIMEWDDFYDKIKHLFKGDELVLDLGCGSSEMAAIMQKTIFKTVVAIDISNIIIRKMIEKHKENKNLIFLEMDCRILKFKNESFDIVFDKGTLDAVVLGSNQEENVYITMREVWRVLKFGGYFIIITSAEPKNSLDLYKGSGMSWIYFDPIVVDNKNANDKNFYQKQFYIYIFQKIPTDENLTEK